MRKNYFIVLLTLLVLVTGCNKNNSKKEEVKEEPIKEEEPPVEPKEEYKDLNEAKIGLYSYNNGVLELIDRYETNIQSRVDIGVFLVFPENDQEVVLNDYFANDFYNRWMSIPNHENLKIGFNLKYKRLDGTEINYNLLDYDSKTSEIYNYLYDDYANRNRSWYSHIEAEDYNEDTLFTSIKLYGALIEEIEPKIYLTVFTYDTLDDFDEDGNYRGNSSYTMEICDVNKTCN